MRASLLCGDSLAVLRTLPDGLARCCVTSPPYFGLRDYGVDGQMGLEATPDAYVARMVELFREVRRVLTDDGTLWLNMGDSYARDPGKGVKFEAKSERTYLVNVQANEKNRGPAVPLGLKPKDLIGVPWRVAFALQADGWYLRSDIIWHKPNPMPESVTDRPTKAHEYVFLLSKSERYYYDAGAVAEDAIHAGQVVKATDADTAKNGQKGQYGATAAGLTQHDTTVGSTRNARTVWTIATRPYAGAHFATMPPELAERCILAGSAPGDTVLDPFGGSGTTASVAVGHGRRAIHIDLNPAYIELARERIGPMLCDQEAA